MKKQPLQSIFNIDFGSSKEHVKSVISTKNGILDTKSSDENILLYDNIKYAGYGTDYIIFVFGDDKLARTLLKFSIEKSELLNLYRDLRTKLNYKYFVTDKVYEFYEEPYDKNDLDGIKIQGIESGLIEYSAYWMFREDSVCLEITSDLDVILCFENHKLIDLFIKNRLDKDLENM